MALYWPTFLRRSLAIVFDERAIFLLQLKKNRQAFYIHHLSVTALPPNAILQGKFQRVDQVCSILKQAVSSARLQHTQAMTAIPHAMLRSQILQLPGNIKSNRSQALIHAQLSTWHAQGQSFFASDIVFLAKTNVHETVLLCATPKEQLLLLQNIFSAAKLVLQCVDVESYALLRAMLFLAKRFSPGPLMLLVGDDEMICCLVYEAPLFLVHRQWRYKTSLENPRIFQESLEEVSASFKGSCYSIIVCDNPSITLLQQVLSAQKVKVHNLTQACMDLFADKVATQYIYPALIALGLSLREYGL